MRAIAVIPARGGSKGVPRKNVLPLAGKPLLGWAIEAAQAAESIQQVVVSTDDPEIAKVAKDFDAEVIWRPADISDDLSPSELTVLHSLQTLEEQGKRLPDVTAFLQCTAPLTTHADIDGTFDSLCADDADTALAVADFHYFVWQNDTAGDFVGVNHDRCIRKMRQERTPQFIESGSIYMMKTAGFRKHRHRFFGKTAHYVMPPERVLEIDDPVDFRIAQMLLEERIKQARGRCLPNTIDLVVFDFDGVFTDDRVYVSQDGSESVACSRSDGMGIKMAHQAGIQMIILSTEVNEVVRRRAEKLDLEVMHGVEDKQAVLDQLLSQRGIDWMNVVYVGNDVNDVDCLLRVGCGVAVANATAPAMSAAKIVLHSAGGNHAVRELVELILQEH